MKIKVKICGVRSIEAAQVVGFSGADFIGLNFIPTSVRKITRDMALDIIVATGQNVKKVGVFQDQPVEFVQELASELELDFVQLHGAEDQAYINNLKNVGIIKAIGLSRDFVISQVEDEIDKYVADYFLLDRINRGEGEVLNLEKVKVLTQKYSIILGGGLIPESVGHIVSTAHPDGVDVAGGIETDGVEDIEKIKLFVKNAKYE